MKKIILLFLLSNTLFGQEKTKIIESFESVTINVGNEINISTYVQEKKHIPKSKNYEHYTVRIPYNNFNDITNITGYTQLLLKSDKKINLSSNSISTNDAKRQDVFHSDYKFKYFIFPQVEDNSVVEYSYRNKYKEPRLLSQFNFQNEFFTEKSTFKITCDPNVEIGFKIFGNNQDKIKFTQKKEGEKTIYLWEIQNIEAFEREETMSSMYNYIPHIVYYIKNYKKDGKTIEIFGNTDNLYKWYASLVKKTNLQDQKEVITKTNELIKDKTSEVEKAKAIFQWVQKNLNYVAFEYGMGGFIPRDAVDVFNKKYGDCKDMANLINEMFKHAKIKSNLTWIGTRKKPYKYNELPTPIVDNHMIASAEIEGKRYYFDATDKYCEFLFPTEMIQGKEALIGISETEYKIEKVPIISAEKNKVNMNFDLKLTENGVDGVVNQEIFGQNKSNLINQLSEYNSEEQEIWKSFITQTNPRVNLQTVENHKNDYENMPATNYLKITLENWNKKLPDKLIFKPILVFPFQNNKIDATTRKYGLDLFKTQEYVINYNYELGDYKVDFLPKKLEFENELAKASITYTVQNQKLIVNQNILIKTIEIEPSNFNIWNEFITTITKQFNQSVVLIK